MVCSVIFSAIDLVYISLVSKPCWIIMSFLWSSVVNKDWCNKHVRNFKCLCWITAVNNLPVGRCLLTQLVWDTLNETWKLFMCRRYDSWHAKQRQWVGLRGSVSEHLNCVFLRLHRVWFQFDNLLRVERALSVGYLSACDLLANLPGPLALRIEATPASLPLVLNSILLCTINEGSGGKASLMSRENCAGNLGLHFFLIAHG